MTKFKTLLFAAASFSLISVKAIAGDLQQTCNAVALHEEWECDAIFQSNDMKYFCDANVLVDSDQNYYCNSIQDPDLRHFCNATAMVIPSECNLIVGSDMKNACFAILQINTSDCSAIGGTDMKYFCDAVALQQTDQCAEIQN